MWWTWWSNAARILHFSQLSHTFSWKLWKEMDCDGVDFCDVCRFLEPGPTITVVHLTATTGFASAFTEYVYPHTHKHAQMLSYMENAQKAYQKMQLNVWIITLLFSTWRISNRNKIEDNIILPKGFKKYRFLFSTVTLFILHEQIWWLAVGCELYAQKCKFCKCYCNCCGVLFLFLFELSALSSTSQVGS